MDGAGGLGLAARIAGFWPKGWGDARLDEDEGGASEGGQGGGAQYVEGDPSQGRWNTAQNWQEPPPDTNGVPYSEKSHYDDYYFGGNTDPRGQMGGGEQSGGGWKRFG